MLCVRYGEALVTEALSFAESVTVNFALEKTNTM